MSRDPIGEAGGLNLYGFVGNNPANLIDPYGLLVIITVQRGRSGPNGTLGWINVMSTVHDDTFSGRTLDPERVAAGLYSGFIRAQGTRGIYNPLRIQLEGAETADGNELTAIQFHIGNTSDDSTGCILVGTRGAYFNDENEDGVAASRDAMTIINNIIMMDGTGNIVVQVRDWSPSWPQP